jgi:hypothetical protein
MKDIFWRLYSSKSRFSLQPVRTPRCQSPNAQHREQKSSEGPNGSADAEVQEQNPEGVLMAQQTRAIESKNLQEGMDTNALTVDCGSTLCNCSDTRVASLDALH